MSIGAAAIVRELKKVGNQQTATMSQSFFKTGKGEYGEGDVFLGIRVPDLRFIAREHAALPLDEAEKLLGSPYHEARLLALLILVRRFDRGDTATRKAIFDLYLSNTAHINNWDLVDLSAGHIVGGYLQPGHHALLTKLAKSEFLWERRIAIMATQLFIRDGYYDETLRLAELLLQDGHDLIHKAVGWMLREVGNKDRKVETAFLDRHCAHMPRTMLRYAIEKFPDQLRADYMSRDRIKAKGR